MIYDTASFFDLFWVFYAIPNTLLVLVLVTSLKASSVANDCPYDGIISFNFCCHSLVLMWVLKQRSIN